MATQTFYTAGDKQLTAGASTNAIINEFQLERTALNAAFQGVRDDIDAGNTAQLAVDAAQDSRLTALEAQSQIEHMVTANSISPGLNLFTTSAIDVLTPEGGFASCAIGSDGATTLDITVGGGSILTAPVAIGGAPGVPVPISFIGGAFGPGPPLVYVFSGGGGGASGCVANVAYRKGTAPE